jgi:hypothetical protein
MQPRPHPEDERLVTRTVRLPRPLRRLVGVLLAAAWWASAGAIAVTAGNPVPEPHSSCETEDSQRSQQGVAQAELTVINLTDATFDLFWLDYDGARVFYQTIRPSSTQPQPTWVTHPWILADEDGTCYLLVEVTAVQQTMTIGTTTGEPLETPADTPPPRPPQTEPSDAGPDATEAAGPSEPAGGSGFPTPLVVGALAMLGILVGVLFAAGKFGPGAGKGGKKP